MKRMLLLFVFALLSFCSIYAQRLEELHVIYEAKTFVIIKPNKETDGEEALFMATIGKEDNKSTITVAKEVNGVWNSLMILDIKSVEKYYTNERKKVVHEYHGILEIFSTGVKLDAICKFGFYADSNKPEGLIINVNQGAGFSGLAFMITDFIGYPNIHWSID